MLVIFLNNIITNALISLALVLLVLLVTAEVIHSRTISLRYQNELSVVRLRGPPDMMLR